VCHAAPIFLPFASSVVLQMPLAPPALSWAERALCANDYKSSLHLQIQEQLARIAVLSARPEPCLLTSASLLSIHGIDPRIVSAIEERMRFGTTVELDSQACLAPPIAVENSPKLYYDVALTRTLLEKAIQKGRIIPWPPDGPLPHFVSAMSIAFRFHSGEERRVFNAIVAKRHVAAARLAKLDLVVCKLNSGRRCPVKELMGDVLTYRDARLYHDTSHPEGNLNTRGLPDPTRAVKYESLRSFLDRLRPGDLLYKTDLSGAFPSLKNRANEMYTQGLAFEGAVYLEYAMSLGTRTGPDNYDSCLGNPLQALIHDSFNANRICASTTRWVDDFLGLVSCAHHCNDLVAAGHSAFECVTESAAAMHALLADDKTTRPWTYDDQGREVPNFFLEGALGFNIESFPQVVLIIPTSKLCDIRFEARRARTEKSLSKSDLESLYGKIAGVAAALYGAIPFASDLLSLIVECNRNGAERAYPSASLRNDLFFFSDLAESMGQRLIVPNSIDIPKGHVEKDAATGTSTEKGYIAVHICGHVLVFDPPGRIVFQIATQELIAATLSSFCCAALWPNLQIATTDDNANCIAWLDSGHAGRPERNYMLRMRARAMMVSNIREHHEPIASEDNVLADAGTHLNEAKRFLGFATYLSFLSNAHSRRPEWWPDGFPYPPRATGFDRIYVGSPLGLLAERISFTNQTELCFSREEVVEILRAVRLQLLDIANSTSI
jgi:hypothetical protein